MHSEETPLTAQARALLGRLMHKYGRAVWATEQYWNARNDAVWARRERLFRLINRALERTVRRQKGGQ